VKNTSDERRPAAPGPAAQAGAASRVDPLLERECDVFVRYLSGTAPSNYVRERYLAAHAAGVVEPRGGATGFERWVVRRASSATWLVRALDAHQRVFANGSLLRRKLVLLLALLEVRAPHAEALDTPTGSSRAAMLFVLAWLGVRFALTVALTTLVLAPFQLAFKLGGRA
jgi:hypothetical protein